MLRSSLADCTKTFSSSDALNISLILNFSIAFSSTPIFELPLSPYGAEANLVRSGFHPPLNSLQSKANKLNSKYCFRYFSVFSGSLTKFLYFPYKNRSFHSSTYLAQDCILCRDNGCEVVRLITGAIPPDTYSIFTMLEWWLISLGF